MVHFNIPPIKILQFVKEYILHILDEGNFFNLSVHRLNNSSPPPFFEPFGLPKTIESRTLQDSQQQ